MPSAAGMSSSTPRHTIGAIVCTPWVMNRPPSIAAAASAAVQPPLVGHVGQRVNVRAHVGAGHQQVVGGRSAVLPYRVAVPPRHGVQEARMVR